MAHPENVLNKFLNRLPTAGRDDCWEWQGHRGNAGKSYGLMQITLANGKRVTRGAHRISWELFCGEIPAGLFVCHKCDNPPCVNPNHLFLGTAKDNAEDASRKGRLDPAKKRERFARRHGKLPANTEIAPPVLKNAKTDRDCKPDIGYNPHRGRIKAKHIREIRGIYTKSKGLITESHLARQYDIPEWLVNAIIKREAYSEIA